MWLCSVTVLIFYMSYWYLLIRLHSHCHKLWTSNESSHKNAWEFTVVPYEHHFLLFGFDLMDESVIKSELGRNRPLMRCKRWNIMKESPRCQKGGASGWFEEAAWGQDSSPVRLPLQDQSPPYSPSQKPAVTLLDSSGTASICWSGRL